MEKDGAMNDAERRCLQETLARLQYFSKGDQLEVIDGPMTGVAGQSRVFWVMVRRPDSTQRSFVAKFDAKRTIKEWQALAALSHRDFPQNFVVQVGDALGLKEMPPENGMIVYKAANTLAVNDQLLTLHKLFLKHATGKSDHCIASLNQVLDAFDHFYQDNQRGLV